VSPQVVNLTGNNFSGPLPSFNPGSIYMVALDGNNFTAPGGCLGIGCDLYAYASHLTVLTMDENPLDVSMVDHRAPGPNILSFTLWTLNSQT